MVVEQLTYTWARRGLKGAGMLQPVGASAGMWPETKRLHQLALRLCRYDTPTGASTHPTSFGWLDSGATRFAFTRTFLAHDQAGHPGNFAAHIIAGPRTELPAHHLLRSHGASWWWTRPSADDTVGKLPQLDPHDLWASQAAPKAHSVAADHVLAQILSGSRRISTDEKTDLLAAMAVIAEQLPDLLDARTFSSYENGVPTAWFDLSGTAPGHSGDAPSPPAAAAARHALGPRATPTRLARIWGDGPADTPGKISRLVAVGSALEVITTRDDYTADDLLPALRSPHAIDEVLDYDGPQRAVAAALLAGDARVTAALRTNQLHVASDVWARIGQLAAEGLTNAQLNHTIFENLDALPAELLGGLAAELVGQTPRDSNKAVAHNWPVPLLRAALHLPELARDPTRHRAVLDAAGAHPARTWLNDRQIPTADRVELFTEYIRRGHSVRSAGLAQCGDVAGFLLRYQPALFATARAALDYRDRVHIFDTGLEDLLSHQTRRATMYAEHLPAVTAAAADLKGARQIEFLVLFAQVFAVHGDSWGQLASTAVESFVDGLLADPRRQHSDDLLRLAATAAGCEPWVRVLRAGTQHALTGNTVGRALDAMPPASAQRAAALLVDRAVVERTCTAYAIETYISCLRSVGLTPGQVASVLLTAALREAHLAMPTDTSFVVLQVLGEHFVDGRIAVRTEPTGWLKTRPLDTESDRLVTQAHQLFRHCAQMHPKAAQQLLDRFTSDTYGKPGAAWQRILDNGTVR